MSSVRLSQKLPDCQQNNAGNSQETHQQGSQKVDLKDKAGDAAGQIQQPQAHKAGQGIDGDLPDQLHLGEQELDDKNGDQ